jgi:hypothetical protein
MRESDVEIRQDNYGEKHNDVMLSLIINFETDLLVCVSVF